MATTAETDLPDSEWPLSNPWPWLAAGVTAIFAGFLCMRLSGADTDPLRGGLLLLGLLAVGAGLSFSARAGGVPFLLRLPPQRRALALLGLAAFFGLLAGGVTLLWVGTAARLWTLPWHTTELVWLWVVVAPWCGLWAVWCLRARVNGVVTGRAEGAALWTLAALGFFLASLGLYDAQRPADWDSIRMVLGVAALVAYVGGILAGCTPLPRKVLASLLILGHFSGILVAVASAPPGPWLAGVLGVYVYRPYLEFMNLNNSYRFYSPEPTPSTQFWFRLEYDRPDGKAVSHWVKLPDIKYDGSNSYPLTLQFYRRLMLTENAGRVVTLPMPFETKLALQFDKVDAHPDLTVPPYQVPIGSAKSMFPSFARFLARQPHPEEPGLKQAARVKIYRVLHRTIPYQDFAQRGDPRDLLLYLPYYEGEYDAAGHLNTKDPKYATLHCLLPFVRENPGNPDSIYKANIFIHAGDLKHARLTAKGKPVTSEGLNLSK